MRPPAEVREWIRQEARRVLALTSLGGTKGARIADEQFERGGGVWWARDLKRSAETRAANTALALRADA